MSQPAITTTTTNATSQQHPYYPLNALIPHYRPNTTSVPTLLLIFFASCTLLLFFCYFFATRIYAASSLPLLRQQEEKSNDSTTTTMKSRETEMGLSGGELSTLMWFVLSGTIHVVFEGYYVRFYEELAGKEGVLGEMWKEYAFSDSRWVVSFSFICFTFFLLGGLILVSVFGERRRRRRRRKRRRRSIKFISSTSSIK